MITELKKRVILCGTRYGALYLPAIHAIEHLQIVGVLAKGSGRSNQIAEQCGVPLYKNVSEINTPLDLAIVAIGGEIGLGVANELLKKKVPVLLEHPISHRDLLSVLNCAEREGVPFHINSHFPLLPPSVDFLKASGKLIDHSQPLVVNCACNPRTLFSFLDLLMRALGVFEINDFELDVMGSRSLPYEVLTFEMNEVPVILCYQAWEGSQDDSRDSPVGHGLQITFPEGVLSLMGSYGPVFSATSFVPM